MSSLNPGQKFVVENTLDILGNVVHRLRELSPLWEMHLDGVDLDKVEWNLH